MGQTNGCVLTRYGEGTEINITRALRDARESSGVYPHTVYWLVKAIIEKAPSEFLLKFSEIDEPQEKNLGDAESQQSYIMVYPNNEEVEVLIPKYCLHGLSLFDIRDLVEKYESCWITLDVHIGNNFYTDLLIHTIELMKTYHYMIMHDLPWKALHHSAMNKHIDLIELLSNNSENGQIKEILPLLKEAQKLIEGDRRLYGISSGDKSIVRTITFIKENWSFHDDYINEIRCCIDRTNKVLDNLSNKEDSDSENSEENQEDDNDTDNEENSNESVENINEETNTTNDITTINSTLNESICEDEKLLCEFMPLSHSQDNNEKIKFENNTSDDDGSDIEDVLDSESTDDEASDSEDEDEDSECNDNRNTINSKLKEYWKKCDKIINSIPIDNNVCSYNQKQSTYRWY